MVHSIPNKIGILLTVPHYEHILLKHPVPGKLHFVPVEHSVKFEQKFFFPNIITLFVCFFLALMQ